MSEFKLPHVEDLATNSKLPGQLTENFKAIEQAANDLRGEIDSEEQDRKSEDDKLNGRIDKLNDSVNKLNDLVKKLDSNVNDHEQRLKKIEKLLFGFERVTVTDPTDDIKASQSATEISDTINDEDGSISTVVIS
ncbi:hypothetical protein NP061_008295 [Weissella confusa]|uniref:Uncharacterized protein n=1 Tax=Limosilactobacillus reuteri TaxID=1598 RepID=A0A2T5Q491_LIMRT|nr:hypothetical protein [Limosilactobacillus reuteri]MCW3764345.1 hypothetical protein [Weissella confusa]PTV04298.1 hypothetical protein DB325_04445 [Limosilactobacillus reuteri]